jgi:hypothetical protein
MPQNNKKVNNKKNKKKFFIRVQSIEIKKPEVELTCTYEQSCKDWGEKRPRYKCPKTIGTSIEYCAMENKDGKIQFMICIRWGTQTLGTYIIPIFYL